jgi:hypothetical protein
MKLPKHVTICGLEYRIIFVGEKRMHKEAGASETEGCVDDDKGVIYLAKTLKKNPSRLLDTILHEAAGHVLFDASGLGYWLKKQVRPASNKKWIVFQETLIRLYTPALITTLRSLGLLAGKGSR